MDECKQRSGQNSKLNSEPSKIRRRRRLAQSPVPGRASASLPSLPLDTSLFHPGLRLAVGLSGGADSVALLCALAACASELGLALHAAHLHHGLRGADADEDLEFCRNLTSQLAIPFHETRVDVAAEAKARKATIEEAGRLLRYEWFCRLMASGEVDAVATAHTLDDQAETVLGKILRGAWTEGISGIHPVVTYPEGPILRPLLGATRNQVETYLQMKGQSWREDPSNQDSAYTRNRLRHELLPLLETWNPQIKAHMAQMAELARDEEAWWQRELDRIEPMLLLEGTPVRRGGRRDVGAGAGRIAFDRTQLATLPTAVVRRILRRAAARMGARLDFAATEALRQLAIAGRAGQKLELANGLRAERTARELRLEYANPTPGRTLGPALGTTLGATFGASEGEAHAPKSVSVPGEIFAFGLHLMIESDQPRPAAVLRVWKAGDRVRLRYSSSPKRIKEVLERMKVHGAERAGWPVLELEGQIVWMKGVKLEPTAGLNVRETSAAEIP